jgi:hypothetical protein
MMAVHRCNISTFDTNVDYAVALSFRVVVYAPFTAQGVQRWAPTSMFEPPSCYPNR